LHFISLASDFTVSIAFTLIFRRVTLSLTYVSQSISCQPGTANTTGYSGFLTIVDFLLMVMVMVDRSRISSKSNAHNGRINYLMLFIIFNKFNIGMPLLE